jgi:hypothetical protein
MEEGLHVTARAVRAVTAYLETKPETVFVKSVEKDPEWQDRGVDLLWKVEGRNIPIRIEVKGDRQHHTKNFFLETISNLQRQTPGCFVATDSHIFAYYFVGVGELHMLPTKPLQKWFSYRIDEFPEKITSTTIRGKFAYNTVGRLVRRRLVRDVFPDYAMILITDSE